MTSYDVLVVGGGPAGSTCAWQLRRGGLRVVVWDRKPFPRDKICAGWITPHVVAALDLDLSDYASAGRALQPIRGFCISRQGDAESRVVYDHTVSYGIRRCEFDDYLLRRSCAGLRLGEPVRTLRQASDAWVVNDEVRAPMLVGAGGHFCPVAQQLGARLGNGEPIVAAQESEFELTPAQQKACRVEPDVPEIFFTRDLKGYGWVFRKGRYINIGLGRQDTQKLSRHVADFLTFLVRRGKIPADVAVKTHGHPYLLYDQAERPLVADRALIIGDAAGLAYPKSGEGIRPAIESALFAANTILAANGQYGRAHLSAYEQRVIERFGQRAASWSITNLLPESAANALAGYLFGTDWFARHVVLDRWFFHTQQPPIATQPPA